MIVVLTIVPNHLLWGYNPTLAPLFFFNLKLIVIYKTEPFPHFFEHNPISEPERLQLIKFCDKTKFRKIEGGAYIKFINEIDDFHIKNILESLRIRARKRFEANFKKYLPDKIDEIAKTENLDKNFKFEMFDYGPFINIVPKGTFSNAHRDGYKNMLISIFYFGTTENNETQTTTLLHGQEILLNHGAEPKGDEDFSKIERLNYGQTKNAALYFYNSETAFHMVDFPIEADRIIVMMGIEISVC